MTFAFPDLPSESEKEAAIALFESLRHLIPCGECCGHYCSELARDPVRPHVHSRTSLSRWLVSLHNKVNARLGKPVYAYDDAAREYLSEDSQCVMPSAPCGVNDNDTPRQLEKNTTGKSAVVGGVAIAAACVLVLLALVFAGKRGSKVVAPQVQNSGV
jgi:hypothetical protein